MRGTMTLSVSEPIQPNTHSIPPKKRVLIAEDNFDLRTIFSRIFTHKQFDVHLAVDGREAVAWLQNTLPDILILDVNMPHLSGLDVLTYVRAQPAAQHVKVIVVTGNAIAVQAPEAELADLILLKPVGIQELVVLAQRLLTAVPI